jgi:hypothetical protein
MAKKKITTAAEAMSLIEANIAIGLTPVMRGTRFYRHSFSVSQFGSYLYYLDERGTAGRCQFQNVEMVFDFIDLGTPVPGSFPVEDLPQPQKPLGHIMVVATVGGEAPSLLEAAEAAIRVMRAGPERDNLERAIAMERRVR